VSAPLQPLRRARTKAFELTDVILRIARADDRSFNALANDAGLNEAVLRTMREHRSAPNVVSLIALADQLGYDIVLKRRKVKE